MSVLLELRTVLLPPGQSISKESDKTLEVCSVNVTGISH